MTDWQKGDLALCVDDSVDWDHDLSGLKKGCIYTVSDLPHSAGLLVAEIEHWNRAGFWRSRFRKVTPPKADEFDREVIDLLNRKPVEA